MGSSFESKLVRAVQKKREAEGLSIRALSTAVGISFSTLARIERGEGKPDNNSRIRLLQWLGADAEAHGLGFDHVAFVHFRAAKNIRSKTVRTLLNAAGSIVQAYGDNEGWTAHDENEVTASEGVSLSKEELEQTAEKFRSDLGLALDEPLDSLRIEVEGIEVVSVSRAEFLDAREIKFLIEDASGEWSAMSVPLEPEQHSWVVLLNDSHGIERRRVTLLEEYWHIFLGHKLTKVARVAEAYGRTYDKSEEHDAYYLASASLLPRLAVTEAIKLGQTSLEIADSFGVSPELVDYRTKRLGLWRERFGKAIKLNSE